MIAGKSVVALFVASLAACLAASPAKAHAIDGQWCSTDGQKVEINGTDMVTPGGAKVQGRQEHHLVVADQGRDLTTGRPGFEFQMLHQPDHAQAIGAPVQVVAQKD